MVFFIVLLCASLPPSMISAELIGVARTTGPAQINGMSLPGQVNVFSGDRIGTGQDSTLTLSSGPQERVRLAAMSGAQVALEEGNLVISLEKGALGFESMGRTRSRAARFSCQSVSSTAFKTEGSSPPASSALRSAGRPFHHVRKPGTGDNVANDRNLRSSACNSAMTCLMRKLPNEIPRSPSRQLLME